MRKSQASGLLRVSLQPEPESEPVRGGNALVALELRFASRTPLPEAFRKGNGIIVDLADYGYYAGGLETVADLWRLP